MELNPSIDAYYPLEKLAFRMVAMNKPDTETYFGAMAALFGKPVDEKIKFEYTFTDIIAAESFSANTEGPVRTSKIQIGDDVYFICRGPFDVKTSLTNRIQRGAPGLLLQYCVCKIDGYFASGLYTKTIIYCATKKLSTIVKSILNIANQSVVKENILVDGVAVVPPATAAVSSSSSSSSSTTTNAPSAPTYTSAVSTTA